MSNISPSALGESDAEFEARVNRMTDFQEIRSAMRQRGIDAGLVRPDNDPYHLIEVNQPSSPKKFAEVVEFGGHKGVVEGPPELAAAKAAVEFYRSRLGTQQTQQTQQQDQTQQRDASTGRFVAREQQTQPTEAQLSDEEQNRLMDGVEQRARLVRGELSPEDYAAYVLRQQGIDPGTLREVVEERQDAAEVQSWQRAVDEFRNSVEGQDWPGGNRNRDILVEILETSGLVNEADKPAALKVAYLYAKEHSLLVENDEIGYEQALAECQSQKEIDAVNARYKETLNLQTNQGSTFWGSR